MDEAAVTVVESMCPRCQENGETRLLPTQIPYFKSILIASFECGRCHYTNNSVEQLSDIQEAGERVTLRVLSLADLDRQVVRSKHATITVPELELEVPAGAGTSSTVQGMLMRVAEDLAESQEARRAVDPEAAEKVAGFIARLNALLDLTGRALAQPFTFVVDDPAGNSFIENPKAPASDPQLTRERYARTIEQLHAMGYYEEQRESKPGADLPAERQTHEVWNLEKALPDDLSGSATARFEVPCPHCGRDGAQNMCEIDIPGFRKCWVMAFVCENCGAKSNEVKPAGAYGATGRRWELSVAEAADLNRDVLKSDTAAVAIPSLELELDYGTLGGLFSTVEGLLRRIARELDEKMPFRGDSQLPERRERMQALVEALTEMADGKRLPFELVIDDLADLSHIGRRDDELLFLTSRPAAAPAAAAPDLQLRSTAYERSHEQNDQLGLTDMRVENYS